MAYLTVLYPLLTHVQTANIVINFTPIVKDFPPKLRKKTIFSEKTDKYTIRISKCYQIVLFLNEVISPCVFTTFCVDIHAEALRKRFILCVRNVNCLKWS